MMRIIVICIALKGVITGVRGGYLWKITQTTKRFYGRLGWWCFLVSALLKHMNPVLKKTFPITLTTGFAGAITFTFLKYLVKKNGILIVVVGYSQLLGLWVNS